MFKLEFVQRDSAQVQIKIQSIDSVKIHGILLLEGCGSIYTGEFTHNITINNKNDYVF